MNSVNERRRRWARSLRAAQRPRPLPWLGSIFLTLAIILIGFTIAFVLLSSWADRQSRGLVPKDAAALKLDAIKTALTVAAGLGAGVTLLLALRRQSTNELAQQFSENDAREQRITELYVAAAGQLGSEKAAVRLAGLFALERLGQNNPHLRQTVVEVVCAYLRMPYTMPGDLRRSNSPQSAYSPGAQDETLAADPASEAERHQELQVRQAAQNLLAEHTRLAHDVGAPEPSTYWRTADGKRMNLSLNRATLVTPDFHDCHLGDLWMGDADIHAYPWLERLHIHGIGYLAGTRVHSTLNMKGARFYKEAHLQKLQCFGDMNLAGSEFCADALADDAIFHQSLDLSEVRFRAKAILTNTEIHGDLFLNQTEFEGVAHFQLAQIHGTTNAAASTFHQRAAFNQTRFRGAACFPGTQFRGEAVFDDAQFSGIAMLSGMHFHVPPRFWTTQITAEAVAPPGWVVEKQDGTEIYRFVLEPVPNHAGESSGSIHLQLIAEDSSGSSSC